MQWQQPTSTKQKATVETNNSNRRTTPWNNYNNNEKQESIITTSNQQKQPMTTILRIRETRTTPTKPQKLWQQLCKQNYNNNKPVETITAITYTKFNFQKQQQQQSTTAATTKP